MYGQIWLSIACSNPTTEPGLDGKTETGRPDTADTLADTGSAGIDGAATIHWDAHGTPHIVADTDEAAFYAAGHAAAQARISQMAATVRAVQGRLSEVVGDSALDDDRRMRILGLWQAAQASAEALSDHDRAMLEAYAAGVNAYLDKEGSTRVAADLGITLEPWTPTHSIAAAHRFADFFSSSVEAKLQADQQFQADVASLGYEAALAAWSEQGFIDEEAPAVLEADVDPDTLAAIDAYAAKHGLIDGAAPPSVYPHEAPKFSHAWAVPGDRSASGSPILVGDPQIPVVAPNLLFEWSIEAPSYTARGISPPGVPSMIIGFTDSVAWSVTALGADQRDLYAVDFCEADAICVDDEVLPVTYREEVIASADGGSHSFTVTETAWGPLTDPWLGNDEPLALHAVPSVDPSRNTVSAQLGMMRSTTLDELRASIYDWTFPSANLVAADADEVFYTAVGDLILRSNASPLGGMVVQDGTTWDTAWADVVPMEVRPWTTTPSRGYVMSANHAVVGSWYPIPLGVGNEGQGDTARSRRLRQLLDVLPDTIDQDDMNDLVQSDCVSAYRKDTVELALRLPETVWSAEASAALAVLEPWFEQGGHSNTGVAGAWLAYHLDQTLRDEALTVTYGGGQNGLDNVLDATAAMTDEMLAREELIINWLDVNLASAWRDAGDPDDWAALHSELAKPSNALYVNAWTLPVDLGGEVWTAPEIACPDGFTVQSLIQQSYHQLVDLGDTGAARSVMPPGNTEVMTDPAFDAQADLWAAGLTKPAPVGGLPDIETTEILEPTW